MPDKIKKISYCVYDDDPALLVFYEDGAVHALCAVGYEDGPGAWAPESMPDVVNRARILDEGRFKKMWPEIKLPDEIKLA